MDEQQLQEVNNCQQKKGDEIKSLTLLSVIGFNGLAHGSLSFHPDRSHIVYPLGNTVVIEDINSNKQEFLKGHTNTVTCATISRSGRFIASGQQTHMGFKAMIIVWDFEKRDIHCKLELHKVKVQDLAFSPNDLYLMSLGGQDDGAIVIWDVKRKQPICGSEAAVKSAGTTFCVAAANKSDNIFFSGGDRTLRVWELDVENRKIRPTDVSLGQLKRIVKCIVVAPEDDFFYCATTTGDILKIIASTKLLSCYGPKKNLFGMGVVSMALITHDTFLVGTGDGTVAHAKFEDKFKVIKKQKVDKAGAITSLTLRGLGHQFLVGTCNSHMYRFNFSEFSYEMIRSCHYNEVNDITFPANCSELFVTSSKFEIRVWNTATSMEILRISVPNMECLAVCVMPDGKSIVSGWNDNKIRAFKPQSGKLIYEIADAHKSKVTALAVTSKSKCIISGGGEGQVRIWDIGEKKQMLKQTLKEHKGVVSFLRVKSDDTECVSASTDGTCIIWDLQKFVRKQIVFENTLFKCVAYGTEEKQIITCGTDRKVAYWNVFDSTQIRDKEASSGSVNALDMSVDGKHYVIGGDDALIKVWNYAECVVTDIGDGHCSEIKRLRICPNQKYIISVSADGAIFRWEYPYPLNGSH